MFLPPLPPSSAAAATTLKVGFWYTRCRHTHLPCPYLSNYSGLPAAAAVHDGGFPQKPKEPPGKHEMANPKRRRLGFSRTDRCFLDVYTETYMRKAFEFPVLAGVSSCPLRVHSPALTAFFAREKPIRKISLPRWKLGSSDREVVVVVAAQEKGGQRKGKLEKYFLSPSSPSSPPSPYLKSLTHREGGHFTSKLEGEEGDRAMGTGGGTSESHRCTMSIKSNHSTSFLQYLV